ncbi:MFS transporter [Sulfurimonas sp. HSL-1716]|uniref:MFS transporter n=1 Tax=Hydrocurvibacter sulfurireducens TaxID=3131937 RepID=UPI0031F7E14E
MKNRSAKNKYAVHGFFISIATTIAEPATILPLMVSFFGGSHLLIGFFTSLIKGGSILVQLFAAFYAQSYPKMMPYLYRVFAARFFAWFSIGFVIFFFGKDHPDIALVSIGTGLFLFSFAAGFGSVYFNEIVAKVFTHKTRGKAIANRQFFMGLGSIISGGIAGWIMSMYEAPYSYGVLYMFSALLMLIGIYAFATIEEPVKEQVSQKEEKFRHFLKNSFKTLRADKALRCQILVYLFSYTYLLSLPFIILDIKDQIHLSGFIVGGLITAQMAGGMISNILWGYLSQNRYIVRSGFVLHISAIALMLVSTKEEVFFLVFFLIGAAMDGLRLAFSNMILIIAPEHKRPVYIALQSNLTSLGLFFPVLGALLVERLGYHPLYGFTLLTLSAGFLLSLRLK